MVVPRGLGVAESAVCRSPLADEHVRLWIGGARASLKSPPRGESRHLIIDSGALTLIGVNMCHYTISSQTRKTHIHRASPRTFLT